MGDVNTTANYGSLNDAWVERAFMQRPKPFLIHNLFAKEFDIPTKNTKSITMRQQNNFNSDPVVLTEGVDPASDSLTKRDITITVNEFGKVVKYSRDIDLTVQNSTATETVDNITQTMHEMLDKVTRNVMQSAIATISCTNGGNGNAITELTQKDTEKAIAYLDENNTEKMTPIVEPSQYLGTAPIDASFWVLANIKLKSDIRNINSFIPVAGYGTRGSVLKAEFGATDEARWVLSQLVYATSDSTPIYSNTFIGAGALGIVTIDSVSTELVLNPLGYNDSLKRIGSIGFTAYFNAGIIDDSHIVNLLSTKGV